MKNLMKKSKKNEEMAIKKEELKKEEKIHKAEIAKKSNKSGFFAGFLGGLIFLSSSAGLFFLYKFRSRFTK